MMYKNEDDYIIFAIGKETDAILFDIFDRNKGKDCKEIDTTINILLNGVMNYIPQINYTLIAETEDEDIFFIFIDCNGTEKDEENLHNHFLNMFTNRNNWMRVSYIIPDNVDEYQKNDKKTCNQKNKENNFEIKLRKPVYYLLPRLSDILSYQVSGKLCKYEGKYLIQTSVMTNLDDYLERFYPKYPPEIIKVLKSKGEIND